MLLPVINRRAICIKKRMSAVGTPRQQSLVGGLICLADAICPQRNNLDKVLTG